jgi:hypothetical protein
MKKAILFTAVVFLSSSSIWAQVNLVFENKSSQVNDEIAQQIKEAYLNLKNGDELLITVLSSKELKKLEDKDKIGFSRSRCNKIINYCTNSLTIHPLNIKYVFTPLANPKKVVSSTNESYRNFTNRSGIYNLIIYRTETYMPSGTVDTSRLKSKIITIKKSEEEYIYGEFVKIRIPENSFDCSCEKIEFEMKEYFSITDILLSGLTTRSDDKILETGGMLYLAAFCNGKGITLKNKIEIQWLDRIEVSNFKAFIGVNSRKMINWKLDQDINLTNPVLDEEFEMNEEEFNEIDKIFITTNKLGWINADKFIESEDNTNLIVKVNTTSPALCVRLIFKKNKTVLPGYFTNHDKTILEFNKIPNGKKSSLLVYEFINKTTINWNIVELTTGDKNVIENLILKKSSMDEFKNSTRVLW